MNITQLFENVVAGSATNMKFLPKFANNFLDSCWNVGSPGQKGVVGATYSQTINLPVVNPLNVANIGSGSINLQPIQANPVAIITDQKISTSRQIQTFDQARTPVQMRDQFLFPMLEELMRYMNLDLAMTAMAGFTPSANLTNPAFAAGISVAGVSTPYTAQGVNPIIPGPTSSPNPAHTRIDVGLAWQALMGQGCPGSELMLITQHVPYGNMCADPANSFISNFFSESEASSAQRSARLLPQFGAVLDYDQLTPSPSSAAGTYGAVMFHKSAVAILPFTEEVVEGTFVKQTTIYPTPRKTIPFTVQIWPNPSGQGVILHVFVCYGRKVVMPSWGVTLLAGPAAAQPAGGE